MFTRKLKIGILLDSYQLPHWAYIALKRVAHSSAVSIELVVLNHLTQVQKNKETSFIYRIFDKLDRFLFKSTLAYAALHSSEHLFFDIPTLKIAAIAAKGIELSPEELQKIEEKDLDILIKIGFDGISGDILDTARYGIWAYQLGDHSYNRGRPAGLWEVVNHQPSTGVTLKILQGQKINSQLLYRSSTMTKDFKPSMNKPQFHYRAAGILSRQIDLLFNLGADKFFEHIKKYNNDFDLFSYPDFQEPDNKRASLLLFRYVLYVIKRILWRTFYFDHWYLFYNLNPEMSQTLNQFTKLIPPKDRFWADPHVIHSNDTYYIYFEELMYNTNRGHISVIEMDKQGNCKDPVVVLKKDYHLSYPFIFKHHDKYYMLPESEENQTIELYESTELPFQWTFKMNLMENVKAVDTTLFFKDNKWWLFTAMEDVEGSGLGDELYLFWSEELFTQKWQPHPLNPVVSDVRTARPAGKIFIHHNKIYRPSQNCSVRYGYATNMNEIITLNEQEYYEKKVAAITPNWDQDVLGTHTFIYEGDLTIVDAYYPRSKFF